MPLNKQQKLQVQKQLKDHRHDRYQIDLDLGSGVVLKNFIVYPCVLRPERMVALELARYLFNARNLYRQGSVLDMGCGTGIQGIVTGLHGATQVVCTDVSSDAVANTKENIKKFNISQMTQVVQGDLFKNIKDSYDLIVFNHPFFPGKPIAESPVSITMLDEGNLLQRFLNESKDHLSKKGSIIMPYFDMAGPVNDPLIQGEKHGYVVEEMLRKKVRAGNQAGIMTIYRLSIV